MRILEALLVSVKVLELQLQLLHFSNPLLLELELELDLELEVEEDLVEKRADKQSVNFKDHKKQRDKTAIL
jgi:hypothetical protein